MNIVKTTIVTILIFALSINANTAEQLENCNSFTPIINVNEVSVCKGIEKKEDKIYITEVVNIKCSWYVRISVQYHGLKDTYEVDKKELVSPEWEVEYWCKWIKSNLKTEK